MIEGGKSQDRTNQGFISGSRKVPAVGTHCGGFTFIEIMVALVIVAVVAAAAFWSLAAANRQAGANRLFTAGQAIAQNQIELFQTDGPFNPQLNQPVPLSLQIDTRSKQNVVIYTDPLNDNVIVTGTLTTTVSDPGITFNSTNLNMRQVTVRLNYTYAGHNYVVSMNSMRTSDL
jgi:prepilin-type N-terminal cleavage/methylation domain-containing protein